jgi:hypothetical protein
MSFVFVFNLLLSCFKLFGSKSVLLRRVAALLTCVKIVDGNVTFEINFCIMTKVKIVTANQP